MAEGGGDGRKGILPGPEDIHIDAAFRSSNENEAYIFVKNWCASFDYSTDDHVVQGWQVISEVFPSLAGTRFAKYGIDCAFNIPNTNEAFIFHDNLCALLNFKTSNNIIKGPSTIASMFPFLKGTDFVCGVDAAFESVNDNEAYLFKGSTYAIINYSDSAPHMIASGLIIEIFPNLGDTIFKDRIKPAFASHSSEERYIFNGSHCALFNLAPEHRSDVIHVKEITQMWPCLSSILPFDPPESGGGHVHGVL